MCDKKFHLILCPTFAPDPGDTTVGLLGKQMIEFECATLAAFYRHIHINQTPVVVSRLNNGSPIIRQNADFHSLMEDSVELPL